jgi:hypothetical protein
MSEPIRAELVPYSSVVGQSIVLRGMDGVFAQLAVRTPNGPPPGETHQEYSWRIAKLVADAINKNS